MPEISSLLRQRLQAGENTRLQHPDADTLTAYVEQLLPAPERKLVLEHIAVCGDCREIVFLATPEDALVSGPEAAGLEPVAPEAVSPSPARRLWFQTPGFGLAASIAAMAVAVTLVMELPHKNQPFSSSPATVANQVSSVQTQKASDAKGTIAAPGTSSSVASSEPAAKPSSAPLNDAKTNANSDVILRSSASVSPSSQPLNVPAKKSAVLNRERDTRQPLSPEIMAQVAAAKGDVIGGLAGASSPLPGGPAQVTSAAPVLEARASRQDYLNAQRFSKDAVDSASAPAGQTNLPSAPDPSSNSLANGSAYSRQSTLLSGSFQQQSNAYLVIPEAQQQTTQGTLAFTPRPPEHQSLLSKIFEVGKRPIKRAEPALQSQNVSRFAMFNNGLSVQHSDPVAANSTVDVTDSPSLAKSPAFTARGFGASRKAFLGAASIYRWKVAQGKLLKSADAVIWLPGYAATDGIEFSAVHSSGSEIWAGGNRGQLIHSSDGGLTWEKASLGDATAGSVVSIESTGLNVHVVTAPSQSWSSLDGGKTWIKLPQ